MLHRSVAKAVRVNVSWRPLSYLAPTVEYPHQRVHASTPEAPIVEQVVLENGVKIVSRSAKSNGFHVTFSVGSGSRLEHTAEKGAAHFLASTAFAGTGLRSGLRLVRDIENLGHEFGATADREKITYSAKGDVATIDKAFENLAEVVYSPLKKSYVFNELKDDVQLSYDEFASTPQMVLSELLHEAAYGEATPLGSSIYASDLHHLSASAINAFRERTFGLNNLTIAVSSALPLTTVKGYVEKAFSRIFKAGAGPAVSNSVTSPFIGGDVRVRASLNGGTHVALAFPLPSGDAAKPFIVLQRILGARLSAGKPKGSYVHSFAAPYSSTGLFGVYAFGSAERVNQLTTLAVSELKAIAQGSGVSNVDKVKKHIALHNALAQEEGKSAELLLSASAQGLSLAEYTNFSNVSASDVSKAAAAVLKSNPAYAVLGKTVGVATYNDISKLLK